MTRLALSWHTGSTSRRSTLFFLFSCPMLNMLWQRIRGTAYTSDITTAVGFVHQLVQCYGGDDGCSHSARACGDIPALLLTYVPVPGHKRRRHALVQPGAPIVDIDGKDGFHDTVKYCHVWCQCICADTLTVVTSFSSPLRLRAIDACSSRVWDMELPLLPPASAEENFPRLCARPPEEDFDFATNLHCACGLVAAVLFSFRVAIFDLKTGRRLGLSALGRGRRVGQLLEPTCVAVLDPRTVGVADELTRRITLFDTNGIVRSTMNLYSFGRMRIFGMVQHAPGEMILLNRFAAEQPVVVSRNTRPPRRVGELPAVCGTIESIAPRRDGNCAVAIHSRCDGNSLAWAVLHTWTLRTAWISGCATLARARTVVKFGKGRKTAERSKRTKVAVV